MLEVEVGDVDPLRAERLEDPGEDARTVRDVDTNAVQRARVLVRGLEHLEPVAARLPDPARHKAGIAFGESGLELLDATAMLGQRRRQR